MTDQVPETTDHDGTAPPHPDEPGSPGYWCNARVVPQKEEEGESGEPRACRNRAGYGCVHFGRGRCKFHGGISDPENDGRVKHLARSSQLAPTEVGEEVAERLEGDPKPVAKMRLASALQEIVLERVFQSEVVGQDEIDLETAKTLSDLIDYFSRSHQRIAKARDRDSVTPEQLHNLLTTIVTEVRKIAGEDVASVLADRIVNDPEYEILEEDAA